MKRRTFPRLALCCAAAGAVALGGCGGSSTNGSSSNGSSTNGSSSNGLTKAQLAAKADAACAAFNQAVANIPFSTDPAVAAQSLDKINQVGDTKQQTVLQTFKPNSSAKPLWDRYLAARDYVSTLFEAAAAKAHANDQAGLIDIQHRITSYVQHTVVPIASELGATGCT